MINEAEKFSSAQEENIHIVENKELGISYQDTLQELPSEIQEKTGVKRIRRREVLTYPEGFCSDGSWTAENSLWLFLTDGRFPSYKTWNHVMSADWQNPNGEAAIRRFNEREDGIFDEFFPAQEFRTNRAQSFFERTEGKIEMIDRDVQIEDAREMPSYFPMSIMDGGEIWGSVINAPVFVFGGQNKLFVDYINSITNNSETRKMLELSGWVAGSPRELITRDSPDFEKYKRLFRGHEAIIRPKIDFPQEYLSDGWVNYPEFDTENDRREFKRIKNAVRVAIESCKPYDIEISSCRWLFEEKDVLYYQSFPPHIPVIRHPDIKPLRWSHSELAVIPKEKKLEIAFFETE
ncbi:MAG: hypothetical protein WC473_04790 [Patescibacteria group bacterium]